MPLHGAIAALPDFVRRLAPSTFMVRAPRLSAGRALAYGW
ncbi:hypothetical protein BURPS1106B_A3666 [Burkholderia pseudomallei 1106b]|uniref:Uncharacterized protein n=1 Tax=Burkholderia pseudomallei (strain 1106a) TaxID=357348 RepID=A3NQP6_BURP0|nr:hypothetical protein BURPS1106A_0384 [Burkholderia pseudomallei 1106a]AFR14259.1 hypothetical protein BPC006_I0369 [Burkholderia pseudomallei BPC006]EES23828.1 hypothetical protein BURPS1106B_A3666 [Burkholderia pseudomallei 1106b]